MAFISFVSLFYCNLLTHNPHTERPETTLLTAATLRVIYVNHIIFSFFLLTVFFTACR